MAKKSKNQKKKKQKKKLRKKSGANSNKSFSTLNSNVDDQYERIYKILGIEMREDEGDDVNAIVNDENLEKFLKHLKGEITFPIIITGIEDMGCFGWEEYYNFGLGNKAEYEKLKKKYPSFRDKYELLSFIDEFDEEEGIYVEAQRISDKKTFTLTLADLKSVEKNTNNSILLDDYAVWYTNFR
jgi:hypothetical protein